MVAPLLAAMVKLLAWVVFAGWVLMWAMRPTYTFKKVWQPKLQSTTNTTYFGPELGTNILIYTFPIMFISVLGCVYLHFKDKLPATQSDRAGGKNGGGGGGGRLAAFWRRPALWNWPLGIVSWTQLCFFLMFVALLVWSFAVYLKINFTEIDNGTSMYANMSPGTRWQKKLRGASLRSGYVGALGCASLFFPVTRGSSLLPVLFGLSPEESIRYHVWLGHATLLLFALHSAGFVLYWAVTDQAWQLLKWQKVHVSNMAGEISAVIGLVLWATTLRRVRRSKFELFFYTHQLYALFIFFFLLHVGISYFCLLLPGVYLFLLDRYLRLLQSQSKVRLLAARLLPNGAVELNFSKTPGLSYGVMSTAFINVPSISKLQWHPFTVSSNSSLEPETLSVVVARQGTWSHKLSQAVLSAITAAATQPLQRLEVAMEGPYGHVASRDLLRYESLIMVSGGSGITPFISIIRELLFRISATNDVDNEAPRSVRLICAFKTSADLTMLELLLPCCFSPTAAGNGDQVVDLPGRLNLKIEAFVTRETAPPGVAPIARGDLEMAGAGLTIRTLRLKPLPSDVPVAAVLGPSSWLWLGAVISASFAAFLLLLGILDRYYIYPVDENSGKRYSETAKALLHLLLMCACVVGFASAAFYWVRRRRRRGLSPIAAAAGKRVHVAAPTSPSSPPSTSLFSDGDDRELESRSRETQLQLQKYAKVHYGARPEFKKMLLDLDDVATGVLVSGPPGMRREVARICSSGLAQNLHFRSVSFTW